MRLGSGSQASASVAPFPLIVLEGTPLERGIMHGELARDRIERSLSFYGDVVAPAIGASFGRFCDLLLVRYPSWRAAEPELGIELEGIAEGSRCSIPEILALNARASLVGSDRAALAEGCTSFALTASASRDGHIFAGQNWDYLRGTAETLVLLHVRTNGARRYLMLVEAGQLARYGASEAGFSLNANGLSSEPRDLNALPWPWLRRRILRSGDFEDAKARLIESRFPDSSNLLLVDRSGLVIDLEVEPGQVRNVEPQDGFLVHSNHYLTEVPDALRATYVPDSDSLMRYGGARRLLTQAVDRGGATLDDLVDLTRHHLGGDSGVCMHAPASAEPHLRWQTVATLIADLTAGHLWVGAGLACDSALVRMDIATAETHRERRLESPDAQSEAFASPNTLEHPVP